MLGLILRLRFLLLLFRLFFIPLLAFLLAFFVFLLIGWSLYTLAVVETLKKLPESPYLYGPLLLAEILIAVAVLYLLLVYINKIRKKYKGGG